MTVVSPRSPTTTHWTVALVIGLVVALAVAGLLIVLVRTVGEHPRSPSERLLDVAGKVAGNTQNIPAARARPRPCWD